ncbi:serine palmitoyltransferase 1 isoform X2 [Harmonia axyridis]|uniref:serine palmitoyltransferase 1 isoform X2 n=1 Tax=Harmonia axyridis TaxID=115357 RepID=UPI001E279602|nr:serine palmitoyltransferase 1 isoform X2 [Harmonia axyridis]
MNSSTKPTLVSTNMLDEKLLQERLNQFKPKPLIEYKHDPNKIYEILAVENKDGVVDLAKTNFLGMLDDEEIKKTAEETIRKYGVGTCGPRAFYGTTDVHLALEEKIANFLGAEECIIYSYGFVAISSSIAAYIKRKDVVFADKESNEAIKYGLASSKSRVVYYNHNDPESLLNEVEKIRIEEAKKKPSRKFLIVEGVSWCTGQLCNLPKFVEVAEQFKMRIFLDETYSLGVLGKNGKGLTEHFGVDISKIDMTFGTIEGALGSIGGYCAGSHAVIEHQRLSGSGYIFSASLPTYLAQIAIKSIELMGDKPSRLVKLANEVHDFLERCDFEVISHPKSPFKVFKFKGDRNRAEREEEFHKICAEQGIHLVLSEKGLVANLNVNLCDQMQKVYDVFEKVVRQLA